MMLTTTYSARVGKLLVVILILVFTSGFAVVQHSCPMDRGAECPAVCSAGSMNGAPAAAGISLRRAKPDCCTVAASVDLKSFTAVFENHQKTDDLKVVCPALPAGSSARPACSTQAHRLVTGTTNNASPPAAEKYILFASLLI